VYIWKKKKIKNFIAKQLQVLVIEDGKLVYDLPSINEIKDYSKEQLDSLWEEVKRFENPHEYYVDLSKELWFTKQELIQRYSLQGEDSNEE
jgi:nicotinate phosphoribosyltransferase